MLATPSMKKVPRGWTISHSNLCRLQLVAAKLIFVASVYDEEEYMITTGTVPAPMPNLGSPAC